MNRGVLCAFVIAVLPKEKVLHPWPEQQFYELILELRAAVLLFRYESLPTAITAISEGLLQKRQTPFTSCASCWPSRRRITIALMQREICSGCGQRSMVEWSFCYQRQRTRKCFTAICLQAVVTRKSTPEMYSCLRSWRTVSHIYPRAYSTSRASKKQDTHKFDIDSEICGCPVLFDCCYFYELTPTNGLPPAPLKY